MSTIGNRIKHIRKLQGDYFKQDDPRYNCGGFALNNKEWYRPYDYDAFDSEEYDIREAFANNEMSKTDAEERLTDLYVDYMLEDVKGLRIVYGERDLKKNEYLIAFRVDIEGDDFHYCRRSDEGVWYHKMGWGPIHECDFDVYDAWDCGCFVYDGPLIMFAMKKY